MRGIDVSGLGKGKNTSKTPIKGFTVSEILSKDIKLFGDKLSDQWKESFYSELYTLLSAGLDIQSTLQLIAVEQDKEKHRKVVNDIKEAIINGAAFYEALQANRHFTPYEYYSVQIGEETGRLTNILTNLNKYYTNKIQQRRQLISALSYPVIVLLTAFLAVVFMLNFIVPMFADVFIRFGGDLPYLTQLILSLSQFMQTNILLMLLVVAGLGLLLRLVRNKNGFRRYASVIVLRTPYVGKLVQQIHLAQFCEVMGLLTASRIPLVRSIEMVSKIVRFYPIEQSLTQVQEDITQGELLNHSLAKHKVYASKMISLIKVGEEVNQLDRIFSELSRQYTEEVAHQTKILSTLLEPLLILFLGLVVGLILIAMYLPMFSLSNGLF